MSRFTLLDAQISVLRCRLITADLEILFFPVRDLLMPEEYEYIC